MIPYRFFHRSRKLPKGRTAILYRTHSNTRKLPRELPIVTILISINMVQIAMSIKRTAAVLMINCSRPPVTLAEYPTPLTPGTLIRQGELNSTVTTQPQARTKTFFTKGKVYLPSMRNGQKQHVAQGTQIRRPSSS